MKSRRFIALVAAFAVAFAALWPLVSAASPGERAIPNFICGQSGVHAPQESAPARDGAGARFHCALCIALAESVPFPPDLTAVRTTIEIAPPAAPAVTPSARIFNAQPPPSRAPPHFS